MDPDPPSTGGTISVSGIGRVAVAPDSAHLRLGVTIARPTVTAARTEAAPITAAVIEAILRAGVERADVRTALLGVQPVYEHRPDRGPVQTGYELSNVVEVTVRDLPAAAAVVDGALAAGATSLDQLTFRATDPAPAERRARELAMETARSRADVLAAAAGLAIDGVLEVVESPDEPRPTPFGLAEGMKLTADVATPIEGGTLEIQVEVRVRYRTR